MQASTPSKTPTPGKVQISHLSKFSQVEYVLLLYI